MAFLQRKRTPQLSPATRLLPQALQRLCDPGCSATGFRAKPERAPHKPQHVAPGHADHHRGKPSCGTRGRPAHRGAPPCGGREHRGGRPAAHGAPRAAGRTDQQPSPHPGAPRPAPAPSSRPAAYCSHRRGLAEATAGGGRRKNPAGSPPPAPGAPATIGPRAGDNREHPHAGAAARSAARRPALYGGVGGQGKGSGGARAGPGHPPLSAPA